MGSIDGWDFGSVDPEQIKREQEEAEVFARCIELEEELEETPSYDKARRQQLEAQIVELTELAELYKNERIALKIASGVQ